MFTESQRREFSADDINRLKTKIWIHDLKIHTGMKLVQHIRERYDPKSSYSTWDNYEKGIHSPTPRKGIDRVKMMAAIFPGSDDVFNCLSWEVLKSELFSETQLKDAVVKLGAPISELILYGSVLDTAKTGGHLIDFSKFCDEIKLFPEFTTVRGIVLLLALAKVFESDGLWNGICSVYESMIAGFLFHQALPFYPEFFAIVDSYALRRERIAINKKPVLIFTSWDRQLPNYKQNLIEHYAAGLRLSYFFPERTKKGLSKDSVNAVSELLVEIVWQCDWAKNNNVSELWGPLMDSLKKLTLEHNDYHKLTHSKFVGFFKQEFHNLSQESKREQSKTSSYTSSFPSMLEPTLISEIARRARYPSNMKIYAPHLNPKSSES